MLELVGFQNMVILDPYGITFNAVGVFGLDSSYCEQVSLIIILHFLQMRILLNNTKFQQHKIIRIIGINYN